jgi:hypothetical protein
VLADAAAAGVVVAAAVAGVVVAAAAGVVATGGVVAVVAAGVIAVGGVVFGPGGVAVVGAVAGVVPGDVVALAAGDFLSLRVCADGFLSAGVAVVAGCSVEVFTSGVVAGVTGFRFGGPFLSTFGGGGTFAAGSFTGGAFAAGSFTGGASDFGAIVGAGFSARGFFPGASFLVGACDSAGVGSWAITAPVSASEATISKLVIFFMVACVGRRMQSIYSTLAVLRRTEH